MKLLQLKITRRDIFAKHLHDRLPNTCQDTKHPISLKAHYNIKLPATRSSNADSPCQEAQAHGT